MYKCSKCEGLYELSEENSKKIPDEHIIKCPHCGEESHIIVADVEYHDYGATPEKPVYLMYGRDKKESDINLPVITGAKYIPNGKYAE